MQRKELIACSVKYINKLCDDISERCVGSEGNRLATGYFEQLITSEGWDIEKQAFDAIDWIDGGASLKIGEVACDVRVSPYSLGCSETAPLASVTSASDLERGDFKDTILLLHGDIAKEQLMPKKFVFYNPQEHQRIIALLEKSGVKALVCATSRNGAVAGGVYPFPLIEDGDFDIPSVYMTEEEGQKLLPLVGKQAALYSDSQRVGSGGFNIIGRKGAHGSERIVITAHIDAKKGTPGAIDNATGVSVLLILSQLLSDYEGNRQIELVALNGEDYYAVPGQMKYIENQGHFDTIMLNINIDGAGYKEGGSSFAFFNLPESIEQKATSVLYDHPDITQGPQWPQGDHSIFVQKGRPAIAVSSQWLIENIENQQITHTPEDNPTIVDHEKIVDIAEAIARMVRTI